MTAISLSFDARDDKGQNKGDFEMFVDLPAGTASPITLLPPAGYKIMGLNLYQAQEVEIGNSGKYKIQNPEKDADVQQLKSGNANQATYMTVFARGIPSDYGFEFLLGDGLSGSTLEDTVSVPGVYEYLIWIRDTSDATDNDFMDPGIRNRN